MLNLLNRALGALVFGAVGLSGQSVTWRNADVSLSDLEKIAPAAAETIAAWLPFAEAVQYRVVLSDDAQVVAILNDRFAKRSSSRKRTDVKKFFADLNTTIVTVDSLLGATDGPLPPAVVVAAKEPDYRELLSHVAAVDPRLDSWAKTTGRSVTGFVLSEPLVAAWLDDGNGQEEWDRRNELVHRVTQLLVRRRAPQQPPWFVLGLAWHVEDLVRGGIYCFPHRSGFVWAAEHGGWGRRLAAQLSPSRRKKAQLPRELTIEEFADWDPMNAAAEFDTQKALIAFGVARFLAVEHPESVARVAQAFDTAIQGGWTVHISETEWITDPNYRLPTERQEAILRSVDPDFLAEVTTAFVRGKLGKGGKLKAPRR